MSRYSSYQSRNDRDAGRVIVWLLAFFAGLYGLVAWLHSFWVADWHMGIKIIIVQFVSGIVINILNALHPLMGFLAVVVYFCVLISVHP